MIISKLKSDQWDKLSKQASKIRDELGNVYSYLLRERDFLLTVNTTKGPTSAALCMGRAKVGDPQWCARPRGHRDRSAAGAGKACLDCGWWNKEWAEECEDCQSKNLELRDRRIWGWIGVQRYLHKSDYGIDFLRNGRKSSSATSGFSSGKTRTESIRQSWSIRSTPHATGDALSGRSIATMCQSTTRKTRLSTTTLSGKPSSVRSGAAAHLVRRSQQRLGLPRNTSPLAQLYAGYRREDQGLNYLVAANDMAVEWAKLFRDGDPQYQTDDMWYQLAYAHDHPVTPQPKDTPDDVFDEMGLGDARELEPALAGAGLLQVAEETRLGTTSPGQAATPYGEPSRDTRPEARPVPRKPRRRSSTRGPL